LHLHANWVFTWAWKSTPERESLVTIVFEPPLLRAARHKARECVPAEQFHDRTARDDHEGGWNLTLEKLARYFR